MEHESIGQKREELHAQIDSLSNTLKLTMSSSMREACEDEIKDYQDRLALLDMSRDDVALLVEQHRSEHESVTTSLMILSISPVEQMYIPVTHVAKDVPELVLPIVVG